MTDSAWTTGCKLLFLELGFLGLIQSMGQVRVSRVRIFRINSVSGTRQRGTQPTWPKPGLSTNVTLV